MRIAGGRSITSLAAERAPGTVRRSNHQGVKMAENENIQTSGSTDPQQAPEQQEAPVFQMQRCYLKDASLEMPHAPEILMQPQQEAPQQEAAREAGSPTEG